MAVSIREDYWENFKIHQDDIESIYNHLLEVECPLTPVEILFNLVEERVIKELKEIEKQRSKGGKVYLPKESYKEKDKLVFPAYNWESGTVKVVRPGKTYLEDKFDVIQVEMEKSGVKEFAANLEYHSLNAPEEKDSQDDNENPEKIIENYGDEMIAQLSEELESNPDFVCIAGKWFPHALLVDVNIGNLNLAEAVLDMAAGGPLATAELLKQVALPGDVNPKLAEFSLDLALQVDPRFDEVGASGKVMWYLLRLEPQNVREIPLTLRYQVQEYDQKDISPEMEDLIRSLNDELSDQKIQNKQKLDEIQITLIYPHWRAGTLPLSSLTRQFFPSAYESARVRFTFVDKYSKEKFPGWVVRHEKYVFGLREWYLNQSIQPGSIINLAKGEEPGEVIIWVEPHRSAKEWVRTALIGADGGVVYAVLKQPVTTAFVDRLMVVMPEEVSPLDEAWEKRAKHRVAFEKIVADTMKDLERLNPQGHVHAAELYSAINVIMRCPPEPIFTLLESRPWFVHVGDFHYRFSDTEKEG